MNEYGPFFLRYNPDNGSYILIDMDYDDCTLGEVCLESGLGWILNLVLEATFLDAGQAMWLAQFLNDLNSTLEN